MTKWVYTFGDGPPKATPGDRNLLGGKGANLAEMCRLGLPVPPGFTITAELCNWYYANGMTYPACSRSRSGGRARPCRQADRAAVRRSGETTPGIRPLRRARIDAGHDGHGPQPRPQ